VQSLDSKLCILEPARGESDRVGFELLQSSGSLQCVAKDASTDAECPVGWSSTSVELKGCGDRCGFLVLRGCWVPNYYSLIRARGAERRTCLGMPGYRTGDRVGGHS